MSFCVPTPVFRAGGRNCRVYEAHCIASSTSSRGDHPPLSRKHLAEYSLRDYLWRSASRVSRLVLSPPLSVYRRVNHCAHPKASATFISQSQAFTANKHIALPVNISNSRDVSLRPLQPRPWNRSIVVYASRSATWSNHDRTIYQAAPLRGKRGQSIRQVLRAA